MLNEFVWKSTKEETLNEQKRAKQMAVALSTENKKNKARKLIDVQ